MLPQDPIILLSFVNTKLRDEFSSLNAFCDAFETQPQALRETLSQVGFDYDPALNQFR